MILAMASPQIHLAPDFLAAFQDLQSFPVLHCAHMTRLLFVYINILPCFNKVQSALWFIEQLKQKIQRHFKDINGT